MNKLLPLLCLSLALSACSRTEKRLEAHVFVPDAVCAHTPALNQGRTSTCWTYASASLLESDWASRRYRAPVAYVHGQAEILESA